MRNKALRRAAIVGAAALTFAVGAASGNAQGSNHRPDDVAEAEAEVRMDDSYLAATGNGLGPVAEMEREQVLRRAAVHPATTTDALACPVP